MATKDIAASFLGEASVTDTMRGVPFLSVLHTLLGTWTGGSRMSAAFVSAAKKATIAVKRIAVPVMKNLPFTPTKSFGVASLKKSSSETKTGGAVQKPVTTTAKKGL